MVNPPYWNFFRRCLQLKSVRWVHYVINSFVLSSLANKNRNSYSVSASKTEIGRSHDSRDRQCSFISHFQTFSGTFSIPFTLLINFKAIWRVFLIQFQMNLVIVRVGNGSIEGYALPTNNLLFCWLDNSKHVPKHRYGFLIHFYQQLGTGENVARFSRTQLTAVEASWSAALVLYIPNDGAANTIANVRSIKWSTAH